MAIYGDFDHTFKQHENLSTAGAALLPVYIATNNSVRVATTHTTKVIGVLQKISTNTGTGAAVMVRLGAISKAIADDTIAAGDLVAASANGIKQATGLSIISDTAGAGNIHILGTALDVSNLTGTVIPVLISPFSINVPQIATAASTTSTITATIP